MSRVRQPLYQRLPEIYRIEDEKQDPSGQFKAYVDTLDIVQSAMYDNIEALYHDFFIETCHDWVIPYLADALGVSHLSGDPWTLRADVARTVKHRRRKGTLGAIESLTYSLSGWAAHTVEMRQRIVWQQHLNHQRPDRFGLAPLPLLAQENQSIAGAVQGGTINLRDPALLSFYNGAFDPMAKVIDVKPPVLGNARAKVGTLAIFLWRLKAYSVSAYLPMLRRNERSLPLPDTIPASAADFVVGYDIHPLGEPMVLFNRHRFSADAEPPSLTEMDAVPGPMPTARLSTDTLTGNPNAYVRIEFYVDATTLPTEVVDDRPGLVLFLPQSFSGAPWFFRGANLCAWQQGLNPDARPFEIIIDPVHGRLLFGVETQADADELAGGVYVSPSYGFSGPTGAHPAARQVLPDPKIIVSFDTIIDESGTPIPAPNGSGLQLALDNLQVRSAPLTIEIRDSRVYDLNINAVTGTTTELGLVTLRLRHALTIRASSQQRPVIRLQRPLAFRPEDVTDPNVNAMNVTLEGLYLSWDHSSAEFSATTALIERVAVNQLHIEQCTLDPGSHLSLDGTRQAARYAIRSDQDFGFDPAGGEDFDQVPDIVITNSLTGPIALDETYTLSVTQSVIDAASGLGEPSPALAIHAASGDVELNWGPSLTVAGLTCFGRSRVASATGEGGIWVHALQVHDTLIGCIKFSYFSGVNDHLPQHQACVRGTNTQLSFTSDIFGESGYAQLRLRSDRKILEQGPNADAMGAFGYLLNTHKWKNINIRYREYMPMGIQPALVPVT